MSDTPADAENPTDSDEAAAAPRSPDAPEVVEIATPEARAEKAEAQNRELHDRILRLAAEFENWKKRARRDQEEAASRGREALLKDLLPALDNLERALKAAPEKDPVAVGVNLVNKQILSALEKFEVKRFSALGQPFDPNLHEAIQQVETSDVAPGSVSMEFAHGYMVGSRLLRAAMVAVAKAPAQASPSNGAGPSDAPPGDGGSES